MQRPLEPKQYTSIACTTRLTQIGGVASMGSVGDALDNAASEAFFATLKRELSDQQPWPTHQAARTAVFEWIECYYNRTRRHSAVAYLAPLEYEHLVYSNNQSHPEEVASTKP